MNTCCFCGEPCPPFEASHGNCQSKWEEEQGRPMVVGVICSGQIKPAELSAVISDAIKESPQHSRLVVRA